MKKILLSTLSFITLINLNATSNTNASGTYYEKIHIKNPKLVEEAIILQTKISSGSSTADKSVKANPNQIFLMSSGGDGNTIPKNMKPSSIGGKSWTMAETILNSQGSGERRMMFGDTDEEGNLTPDTWKDYTITTKATLNSEENGTYGNGYGVYYRADGKDNITGYVFQYDPGLGNEFVVRTVTNGKESTPIQRIKMNKIFPDGFNIADAEHEIKVSVEGEKHVITVDNQKVFDFDDSWRTSGSGGLRAWHNTDVDFSDLQVEQIKK